MFWFAMAITWAFGYATAWVGKGGQFAWSWIIRPTFVTYYGPQKVMGKWKINGSERWQKTNRLPDHFYHQLLRFPYAYKCNYERVFQYAFNQGALRGSGEWDRFECSELIIARSMDDIVKVQRFNY